MVFYGGDSQVGTTMTALALSEFLAKSGLQVLFLNFSPVPGNAYLPFVPPSSVDDLRAAFLDESLTAAELRQFLVNCRGVDILPGVRNWQSSRTFPEGSAAQLLKVAETEWDFILADGGCGVAGGLGVQALQCFEDAVLIVTQQEKTLARFQHQKEILAEKMPDQPLFLINKFNDSGAFYTLKQMKEILQCENRVLTVPYVPYGWQAESEHTTLLHFRRFGKGIRQLAEYVEGRENAKK